MFHYHARVFERFVVGENRVISRPNVVFDRRSEAYVVMGGDGRLTPGEDVLARYIRERLDV